MTSTFHGLETMRRAISAQQSALHTTGHNIANANTPGFSRQRVNFATTNAFPTPSLTPPLIPGQIGTGVKVSDVQRIRESFLDLQFRAENNQNGYWSAKHTAYMKVEDIMNEPTENGLANSMDRFWRSLQDLSVHPEDSGARSVVRQQGIALAETFNYTYNSLESVQRDYHQQVEVQKDHINSLARQINDLNKLIAGIEPNGLVPNDLYDSRDKLVDELSLYLNVSVEQVNSGGLARESAAGRYTIKLLDENGRDLGVTLVDGSRLEANELHLSYDENTKLVDGMYFANPRAVEAAKDSSGKVDMDTLKEQKGVAQFTNLDRFMPPGGLKATIEAYGYMTGEMEKGIIPGMKAELDLMVFTFVEEFNKVHASGWSLSEIETGGKFIQDDGTTEGYHFFTFNEGPNGVIGDNNIKGAAGMLRVSENILNELNTIAASGATNGNPLAVAFAGDGSNALALANVKDRNLEFNGTTTNVQSFYQGVIGNMAVATRESERNMNNTESLRDSVENRRQSVSGVSLDEEMANMIQFQHAYNAAARNITVIDEMLDRIINGMGVVGR
ncbi:flagellar hook-associated protein FlgK [Evansella sp. AB-rgal1]|uniref:flagellar hook-associated protein FlgK n=1 Tax=Evansella sp. AB-rgal1 TaxID=3242696 RepID=UPI00359F0510